MNPTTTDIVTIGANPQPLAHRVDPGALLQAVVEKGVTAESVQVAEKLIALDREMRAEDAKASFSRAFLALRAECKPLLASKTIPTKEGGIKGRFAPLTEIMDHVEPLLEKHGFFWTFDQSKVENGQTRVVCHLTHRDGHSTQSGFTCRQHKSPLNSEAQDDGGTNTLAKRYAILNLFGIRIDYDGDARAGGDNVSEGEADALEKLVRSRVGNDQRRFARYLALAGCKTFREITRAKYAVVMAKLAEASTSDTGTPDRPGIPPCPLDAAKWREGMLIRMGEAMALSPDQAAQELDRTVKALATSYLTLSIEQRAELWASAHTAKGAA